MFSPHYLTMFYIHTKFHENISKGSPVFEQTRNDDGWTDRWTDKVITIGPLPTSSGWAIIITTYSLLSRALRPPSRSEQSGPSCSKLTTLLVNVSLKFQALISQIYQYFLLEKY